MGKIYLPKRTPDGTSILNGVTVHRHFLKDHNVNEIALPSPRKKSII